MSRATESDARNDWRIVWRMARTELLGGMPRVTFTDGRESLLLAAAPAMLKALEALHEALQGSAGDAICKCNAVGESAGDCPIAKAEAAIRLAKGVSQ